MGKGGGQKVGRWRAVVGRASERASGRRRRRRRWWGDGDGTLCRGYDIINSLSLFIPR